MDCCLMCWSQEGLGKALGLWWKEKARSTNHNSEERILKKYWRMYSWKHHGTTAVCLTATEREKNGKKWTVCLGLYYTVRCVVTSWLRHWVTDDQQKRNRPRITRKEGNILERPPNVSMKILRNDRHLLQSNRQRSERNGLYTLRCVGHRKNSWLMVSWMVYIMLWRLVGGSIELKWIVSVVVEWRRINGQRCALILSETLTLYKSFTYLLTLALQTLQQDNASFCRPL